MIKKYTSNLFVLSLSLLISPAWAGKIVRNDGSIVEIPDSVCIRNTVEHDISIGFNYDADDAVTSKLPEQDRNWKSILAKGVVLKLNQAVGWQVNPRVTQKIGELIIKVTKGQEAKELKEYTITYPTYSFVPEENRDCFVEEYKQFSYRLSDIITGNRDVNGFTVQDK